MARTMFKRKSTKSYKSAAMKNAKKYNSKNNLKTVKRVVKQAIARNVETKVGQVAGTINPLVTNPSTLTDSQWEAGMYMLTPQGASTGITGGFFTIGNGTGQSQRIGDEINVKGVYVNYLITPSPYDATFNSVPAPQIATVWAIRPKVASARGLDKNTVVATSANGAIFYENIYNTESGMTGLLTDFLKKVDRDNFEILYVKRHKVGYAGNLNSSNQLSTLPNNDFPAFVQGKFKVNLGKLAFDRLGYTKQQPVYFFITTVRADNVAVTSSQQPLKCNFNYACYYQDA